MLHLIIYIPRVEALRTSTLGWGNATPTELPRVRTACYGLTIHYSRERTSHFGITIHYSREHAIHLRITIHCSRERTIRLEITIHYSRERTIHIGLTTHGRWVRTIYDALLIANALINMEHDEGGLIPFYQNHPYSSQ